mgnify:CR=1 FL=1
MPTYEYECNDCGHVFEVFQSMTAAKLRTCPECRGRVRRLIGVGAGVVFKGSGFYETDYKRAAASKGPKKESSSETKAASKDASSSTTKTEKASSGASSSSKAGAKSKTS